MHQAYSGHTTGRLNRSGAHDIGFFILRSHDQEEVFMKFRTKGLRLAALATAAAVILASGWAIAGPGDDDDIDAPDAQLEYTLLGFTEDGLRFAVKYKDDQGRGGFQLRDSKTGEVVPHRRNKYRVSFMSENDIDKDLKRKWRYYRKRWKVKVPPADTTEHAERGLTLMSAQKADKLIIYVMKGKQIRPYATIQLRKGKKDKPAKATVKRINWDPKGKFFVVIYNQEVPKRQTWKGDFVKTFRFLAYKAKFD